ncbi:MAG: hypothetical protein KDH20_00420 [Rhodocyclaceae bacterium]|nr:hypothetical protein [Rhodocyclaceae bacterium]
MTHLSLTFVDNGTGHNDMVLQLAGRSWACDSYYLALDDGVLPSTDCSTKIRAVLRRLLAQWLEAVREVRTGDMAFLPYDFSDQYTGWLRCTRTSDRFLVARGWSSVEGWSFAPSCIDVYAHKLDDFRIDGASIEMSSQELHKSVNESISRAA